MTALRAQLPPELLFQIFLEVDPHTLYTSIRCLSRQWKEEVEERMIKAEFQSNRWRVGMRITRKPKAGTTWRGGIVGLEGDAAPGSTWQRLQSEAITANEDETEANIALERAQRMYSDMVLSRPGAQEDELPPFQAEEAVAPVVHVIPLHFVKYDGESTALHFDTGHSTWHAIFEGCEEEGESDSRLNLDFSLVWRFPGDGQNDEESDGWGNADQENGWLSRFYCSKFDTNGSKSIETDDAQKQLVLKTTPLARRVRKRQIVLHQESNHPEFESFPPLNWSDEGHEYLSLSLSLGTEFFVRRSARANLLMRKLETEAQASEDRDMEEDSLHQSVSRLDTFQHGAFHKARGANSMAKAQSTGGSGWSTGTSTPYGASSSSNSSRATGSRKTLSSYASIASTPPLTCSSPRGSFLALPSKGPRVVRLQREASLANGYRAPASSAHASGSSSVRHQARSDRKDVEASGSSNTLDGDNSNHNNGGGTTSSTTPTDSPRSESVRAHFLAQLYRSPLDSPDPNWTATPDSTRSSCRNVSTPVGTKFTTWEWHR